MKKIIPFLVMLLVATFTVGAEVTLPVGFNDTGLGDGTINGDGAATKVVLNLGSEENTIVEVWFDDEAPTAATGYRMPSTGKATVTLTKNGTEYANIGLNEDLYACWYLFGNTNVHVDLAIADALKDANSNPITWGVNDHANDAGDITIDIDSNEQNRTKEDLVTYTAKEQVEFGSVQLLVATEQGDYTELPAGEYTGYLILSVAAN